MKRFIILTALLLLAAQTAMAETIQVEAAIQDITDNGITVSCQANLGTSTRDLVVKRVFKWAVAEELIPPSVHQGLQPIAGLRYETRTYRQAIVYGIRKANKMADEQGKTAHWFPLQIRHSRGTEIRRQYGLDAAQAAKNSQKNPASHAWC